MRAVRFAGCDLNGRFGPLLLDEGERVDAVLWIQSMHIAVISRAATSHEVDEHRRSLSRG